MIRRLALPLVCAWLVAACALAAPNEPATYVPPTGDFLVLTGQMDRYQTGESGQNGAMDWVHPSPGRATYTLGLSIFSVADSRWSYGKAGLACRLSERVVLEGQASLGGGSTAGDAFGYQTYEGSATYKAAPRLYLRLGDQFYQIAASRDHLLKPGIVFAPTPRVRADLTFAHSVSGNIGTQFVSARMDYDTGAFQLLGGVSFGRATPERLSLEVSTSPGTQSFQEGFVGFGYRLSSTVLSVVIDALNTDASRRRGVMMGWKIPLGKRGEGGR